MTIVRWTPQVVTGPVTAGFRPAAEELVQVAQALAPRRTGTLANSVDFTSTGATSGFMRANASYSGAVQGGSRPHEIVSETPMPIGGGRFASAVHHPGNRAQPFLREAAPAFRTLYVNNVRGLMHLGL